MRAGSQVARRDKMGAVVGITSLAERPEWFEGDWPEDSSRVAIIAWPGRKKLTVEPVHSLMSPDDL
jgi:hypothetical protein